MFWLTTAISVTGVCPLSQAIFWSKSSELVHQYTQVQQDMFTLEDTLLGYMADGLTWCGDAGSSGEGPGRLGLPSGVWGEGAVGSAGGPERSRGGRGPRYPP